MIEPFQEEIEPPHPAEGDGDMNNTINFALYMLIRPRQNFVCFACFVRESNLLLGWLGSKL